jgi:hypothetical protein
MLPVRKPASDYSRYGVGFSEAVADADAVGDADGVDVAVGFGDAVVVAVGFGVAEPPPLGPMLA